MNSTILLGHAKANGGSADEPEAKKHSQHLLLGTSKEQETWRK